jgi:hypothetical protein
VLVTTSTLYFSAGGLAANAEAGDNSNNRPAVIAGAIQRARTAFPRLIEVAPPSTRRRPHPEVMDIA